MAHIDYDVRDTTAKLVKGLMNDYRDQIETAYCNEDGTFKIAFACKFKPKGDKTKVKVEMSFNPAEKIKDFQETIVGDDPLFDNKTTEDKPPADKESINGTQQY